MELQIRIRKKRISTEENQGDVPNMKFGGVFFFFFRNYKEERAVYEYKGRGIMVIFAQKFHSPYHLPRPNITNLKDLFDLEG